jgi:hypothetical protein
MASKPDVLGDLRDTPKLSSIYGALSRLYARVEITRKQKQ